MIAVDTSVLVAAFFEDHPRHRESFRLVDKLLPETACVSCHTIAEFYVSLTRLPHGFNLRPDESARLAREELCRRVRFISLDAEDYKNAIDGASLLGFAGAVVYDALHLAAASKAEASVFYTWDMKDFTRLSPLYPIKIGTPPHA